MKIAVLDYGMGNLHSVLKSVQAARALADVSAEIYLTDKVEGIQDADKLVFPGQGAMPDCMKALHDSGLSDALREAFLHKPFFGICVGAQLLFEFSHEGNTPGLGWFDGEVLPFARGQTDKDGRKLKIPHMGWNTVHQSRSHPLFKGIAQDARFYFVHSYYFAPKNTDIVLASSDYPTDFPCIVGQDNVFATQFHTEKSHDNGLIMLKNFILWDGQA